MARKNVCLLPGTVLYMAEHYADKVSKIKVMALTPWKGSLSDDDHDCLEFVHLTGPYKGRICVESLGDRGMLGHVYDNRPQQIHSTRRQAEKALKRGNKWFFAHRTDWLTDTY